MIDWELIIKVLALLAPTIAAIIGANKYFYEKNREIYIRRLNEVYAPLFGYLVKQETIRDLYLPNAKLEDTPILEFINKLTKTKISFSGDPSEVEIIENKILDCKSSN